MRGGGCEENVPGREVEFRMLIYKARIEMIVNSDSANLTQVADSENV